MSDNYYTTRGAINATAIKAGALSFKHMHQVMNGVERDDTPALRWGRLVHRAILERDKLDVAIWDGRRAGKEYEAFCDANDGKEILKPDEWEELQMLANAVNGDVIAAQYLFGLKTEQSIYWRTDDYGDAKARLDGVGDGYMVELKTCANVNMRNFADQSFRLGYHLQLGWYAEAMQAKRMKRQKTIVICVESRPPFDVVTYEVDEMLIEAGQIAARKIAKEYRQQEADGKFTGVAANQLRVLSAPAWAGDLLEVNIGSMEEMEAGKL